MKSRTCRFRDRHTPHRRWGLFEHFGLVFTRDGNDKTTVVSPLAEANIHTDSDTLLSKLSEMTVKSERWMERCIMNPQVVCSDSLTSDDNAEERSCQSPRWSLRRDLREAVRQQCPGENAGDGMSGRRTVLQRRI